MLRVYTVHIGSDPCKGLTLYGRVKNMPAKNAIKEYVENGVYHIYNRGVEKRDIFLDENDYRVFLHLLKRYLKKESSEFQKNKFKNFENDIELFAYCLMPNHFHLLIKQENLKSVAKFMQCLITNYVMYFNKRYERNGGLFQGRYKAVLVNNDDYIVHLSRYIHLNPQTIGMDPFLYDYSSCKDYINLRNTGWINIEFILSYFKKPSLGLLASHQSYKKFVKEQMDEELNLERYQLE